MKKLLLSTILLGAMSVMSSAQQTFTITSSGFQFVPATLTITQGDTVEFAQSSSHPAVEVSQATWNANGNTSNGGFNLVSSGTKIKFNTPGTFYYVCNVHHSSGMKGQIIVNAASSIDEVKANLVLSAYPSPVTENLNVVLELNKAELLSIEIYNVIGVQVFSKAETNYASGKNTLQFDFTELSSGAYFIKVIGKEETYTLKVLK